MKLEEVLPALREGKKIYRWFHNEGIDCLPIEGISKDYNNDSHDIKHLYYDDLLAEDWEIDEEILTFNECLHCLSCVCKGDCKKCD